MLRTLSLTALLLATSCLAVEFSCVNLDSDGCKKHFADNFNREVLTLQYGAFRKLCETYIEIAGKVQKELKSNDLFHSLNDLSIKNVAADYEKFNKNIDNEKLIAEITKEAIHHMEFTYKKGTGDPEHFRSLCKKYKLRESLAEVVKDLTMNIGKLWSKMFKNLRPLDLKDYPVYTTLNETMGNLEKFSTELKVKNEADFQKACKELGITFEIPFYDAIEELS